MVGGPQGVPVACLLMLGILHGTSDAQETGSSPLDPPQGTEYRRYYFKQPMPLEIDADTVAIYDESRGPIEPLARLLELAEIPNPEIEEFTMPGWYLVRARETVPGNVPGPAVMISRLIENDTSGRFFLSAVLTGRGLMIPTTKILVQFEEGVTAPEIARLLREAGATGVRQEPLGTLENGFKVLSNSRSGLELLEIANRLAQLPEVIFAEPSFILSGGSTGAVEPNDPLFFQSWGLNNDGQIPGSVPDVDIEAPEGWSSTTGDPSVVSVIIDNGVQQDHPELNQLPGRDFTIDNGDGGPVRECDNHGTWVAGVIGSKINNNLGSVGVAPDSKIISARVYISNPPNPDESCTGLWQTQSDWTVDAIAWASEIGARVTINSNFFDDAVPSIEAEYNALNLRTLHFASAGNRNIGTGVTFPANVFNVVAVSALDFTGELWNRSSFGPEVELTAPGVAIFTTDRTGPPGNNSNNYTIVDGTSFAAPMAAGVAALVASLDHKITAAELRDTLTITTTDLGDPGRDHMTGWGLVNANVALLITSIRLTIFSDGFESGNTSSWSGVEQQGR